MNIILASGSPRRKELLAQAGYEFVVEVSEADENIQEAFPGTMVEELSRRKAAAVAEHHKINGENGSEETGSYTIIGADTVVALDGKILGKPADEEDAFRMLSALSGKTHQVYTGVSLFLLKDGKTVKEVSFHVCTDVGMRQMEDEEIRAYIRTGEPMDKAGAYGIQGKAAVFISGIRGDYYNVVGLPVCELVTQLKRLWH